MSMDETPTDSPYELNAFRMQMAALAVALGVLGLAGLDALKVDKPADALQRVRSSYVQKVLDIELERLTKDYDRSKAESTGIKLEELIERLEHSTPPSAPTWREQLGNSSSALSNAYKLGLAACIAVITVCGLYLLYALAYWLKIPGTVGPPPPRKNEAGDEKKTSPGSGASAPSARETIIPSAIGIPGSGLWSSLAAALSAASLAKVTALSMVTVAAVISGGMLIQHEIRVEQTIKSMPGEGDAGTARSPQSNTVMTNNNFGAAEGGGALDISIKMADHQALMQTDSAWVTSTAALKSSTADLSKASENLLTYVKGLPKDPLDWDKLYRQLSALNQNATTLLEHSRVNDARIGTTVAAVLARDCMRQEAMKYISNSSLGVDSAQIEDWKKRLAAPCAVAGVR